MQLSYNNCAIMSGRSYIYFNKKFISFLQAIKYTKATHNNASLIMYRYHIMCGREIAEGSYSKS